MKRIKVTKTDCYADPSPSRPHYSLVKGETVELPDHMADRVVELEGGESAPEVDAEVPEVPEVPEVKKKKARK